MPGTLGEALLAAAATHAPAVAFQMRRGMRFERTTYTQAALHARRIAAWCVAHDLRPGDRIAVRAPNMPEYALLYFGAWLAGLVVVPIDVRTRQEVTARTLAACDARLLFTSRALRDGGGSGVDTYALEDLLALVDRSDRHPDAPPIADDALAVIAYTSGTTGDPKGVMLTHANLLAEIAGLRLAYPLRPGLVALSVLPLSHIYELTVTFLHGFTSGIRTTYVPRVNAVTIARAMADAHVEAMTVVPELLRLMLRGIERQALREGNTRWSVAHRIAPALPFALRRALFAPVLRALGGRLDFFGVGGAPLDVGVARAWERMGVHVFEGYGLTESSAGATINSKAHHRLGSAGRPMPNVGVRCGPDGEIEIAGPTVSPGYFGDEPRTAAGRRGGWLRTGDVGHIDADGYVFVTGRVAFRIVLPDGRKVYPEDVERELNADASVRDSCVVGLRDERGRERVHAVLLTSAETADDVVRAANARLADHQQIRTWSVWPEPDFPRGPTLKPDRVAIHAALDGARRPVTETLDVPATADPLLAAVARASGRPPDTLRETDALEADLGLDSIGRIELLSIIEEELGVAIDELRAGPRLTVGELREIVRDAEPAVVVREGARWPRSWWARLIGDVLVAIAARIQDHWLTGLEVVHPERIAKIPRPSLIVFNYQAPYAALLFLRSIPRALRHRIAVAADAEAWARGRSYQGALVALAVQGFPLVKTGGASRDSLIEATRWIDDGYAVLLAPEGGPSMREETGEFHGGVGMLAVELRIPVLPFRIEGYAALYPRHDTPFPWLPEHRGRARLIVGEPFCVPEGATYAEATALAKRAVLELK